MAPRRLIYPAEELEEFNSSDEASTKHGRGPAEGGSGWGKANFKMHLTFNEHTQVCGKNSKEFATRLGIIAKCEVKAPLFHLDWRKVPKENKEAIWQEIQMRKKGEDTSRPSVFRKTRLMKNAGPTQEAEPIITQMERRLSEVPPDERTPEFTDQVFTEVMGSDGHGRVRTFGLGPTPTAFKGPKSTSMNVSVDTIQRMLKEQEDAMQAKYDALRAELDALRAAYASNHTLRHDSPHIPSSVSQFSIHILLQHLVVRKMGLMKCLASALVCFVFSGVFVAERFYLLAKDTSSTVPLLVTLEFIF